MPKRVHLFVTQNVFTLQGCHVNTKLACGMHIVTTSDFISAQYCHISEIVQKTKQKKSIKKIYIKGHITLFGVWLEVHFNDPLYSSSFWENYGRVNSA